MIIRCAEIQIMAIWTSLKDTLRKSKTNLIHQHKNLPTSSVSKLLPTLEHIHRQSIYFNT